MAHIVGFQFHCAMQQVLSVNIQQFYVLLRFTTVQPHDSVQIFELPIAPLIQGAVDHGIIIPGVDKQHLVLQFLGLSLIKEPQRTR